MARQGVTVTSEAETPADVSPGKAARNLMGLAKRMGSTLTVEGFIKMKREDRDLEEAEYQRLFQKG